jgi:hypothetical protein
MEEMRLNTDYWNCVYISDANKRGFGDAFGGESTRFILLNIVGR